MIVTLNDFKIYMGIDVTDDSENDVLNAILQPVDRAVKEYCRRDFESTNYTKDLYDGTGETELYLDNYPIISVERLAIGTQNGLKVHNSSSDATRAIVTVNSTGIVLTVSGGDNAGTDTLLFADYATLTLMADAITALGKGWSGEVVHSDYASYKSTELLPRYGAYCGAVGGTQYAYLEIPEEPLTEFEVYSDEGYVYYSGRFTKGHNNIIVDYTGGYATADLPKDLQLAIKIIARFIYDRRQDRGFGLSSYDLGGIRASFQEDGFPKQAMDILNSYKRPII